LVQWPQLSHAVQVTTVVPIGKKLPLGGLQETVVGGQPPVAVLSQETNVPKCFLATTFMFFGQWRTIGGHILPLTVMAKLQLVVWPHASVAVQVTSVLVFAGKVLPLGGLQETVTGPQPPVAELVKFTTTPFEQPALTVMFDEQVSTIGGQTPPGLTVTVKLQFVLLPQLSVATQVTVVTPGGKLLPLGGLQTTLTGPHPPVAELVYETVAFVAAQPGVVTTMLDEQFKTIGGQTGGLTVTVKLQLVTTTPQSKALQVTVVVPIGKKLPLGGLHETVAGPQPPLTELPKKTFAPAPAPQFVALTVMFEEQVNTTGGHGLTLTVKVQLV
jgi:hypothetical protein